MPVLTPPAQDDEVAAAAKRRKIANAIMVSNFMSVCQHVMPLQSEPMLMKQLYNGDISASARALANSQGAVGVLALVWNQFGGKLTDAIGRKPGLLVGPLGNIIVGGLVFLKPTSPLLVIICRIIRMVITTFSNTVVASAALADFLKGQELATMQSKVAAITGLGIVCGPFIEAQLLTRLKHPRYSYLMISILAAAQACTTYFLVPETLPQEKRIPVAQALNIQSANPFGFLRIYRDGSKALQKLVNMTTMQFFLEGKNLSDYGTQWWVNHLKWSTLEIRNFLMGYGLSCVAGAVLLIPRLVKAMSPRQFTTFANFSNFINLLAKGTGGPSASVYLVASFVGLPGVNAASGMVLRALSTDKAVQEGFGKGEFSAWTNNLRAVVGAVAPVLYGNLYASLKDTFPGAGFLVCGILGAVVPQIMLMQTTDAELKVDRK